MLRTLFVSSAICTVMATPALAQQAVGSSQLAEIVVTAQKRSEKLQDVPVSVSVVSPLVLSRANATDITDINKLVPSVQLKGTYNGRVPLGIRGISTNANEGAIGLTSGVAIQIDGVSVPPDSFAANALDDIAQVEVLKGPQATLGGRTASAGVINIVTGSPSRVFKARMTATVTDDQERRANIALSGPLGDKFSFSLAGFASQIEYPVYNTLAKANAKSTNYGVRGKLKFSSGDFDATVMGRVSHFHSQGGTFTMQYLTPGANLFPYVDGVGISQASAFPGIKIGYGNTRSASANADMFATWKDEDVSLAMNYRRGRVTFSSISAYQHEAQDSKQDVALSAVYFWNTLVPGAPSWGDSQYLQESVKQFSQEFKIASDVDLPLSFLAGLYYSNNTVVANTQRHWIANDLNFRAYSGTRTMAAYGRATLKLGGGNSLTAGLRYNHDQLKFQKTQYFDFAAAAYQGCTVGAAKVTCSSADNRDSADTVVGDVSVQHKFGPDNMVYASYTRGYKPRAFNTAVDISANGDRLDATGKEVIDSFEIGSKLRLKGLGTLNLAAFHTVYNGYQVQIFPIVAGGLSPLELSNAGKARTQGVELDFNGRLAQRTNLTLSAAYIDAKFLRFENAPCWGGQTAAQGCVGGVQSLSGKPMPDSPKFKFNADVEQRVPLGKQGAELVLGANLSYRSSTMFQANNNPETRQASFALLNLSAGFDFADGRYNITGFVNNVTNHFYLTNAEDFFSGLFATPGSFSPANAVIGQPARDAHRYVGVRATVKF